VTDKLKTRWRNLSGWGERIVCLCLIPVAILVVPLALVVSPVALAMDLIRDFIDKWAKEKSRKEN